MRTQLISSFLTFAGLTLLAHQAEAEQLGNRQPTNPAASCVTISTLTGAGTGFFIEHNGRLSIVTCRHVVENSPFLVVTDMNGLEYHATNALFSTSRDIALLQIEIEKDQDVVPLKTIRSAKDLVFDMEICCYGDSEGKGVIVKSQGHLLGIGPESIETDAEIVPGNSGGPLLDPKSGLVVAVASYLTKSRENSWNKGTRFSDAVRRFGVRIDNLDFSKQYFESQRLVGKNDFAAISAFGITLLEKGNEDIHPEAKACLEYAADHNDPNAITELAKKYITGACWKPDDEKGFSFSKKAAELGSGDGQYLLSQCFLLGIGTTPDIPTGMFWLFQSASNNCEMAQSDLGKFYLEGKNVEKNDRLSFFWLSKAAENGFGPAQSKLGNLYEKGIGVESNIVTAVQWYKKAIEVNDPEALFRLGLCYLKGSGVATNEIKGCSLIEKAADVGNVDAQVFAGIHLQLGLMNFRKDPEKAFHLFQLAAQQNSKEGYAFLGDCYEWGWGCKKDGKQAIISYIKAGSLGDLDKLYYAGYCVSQGKLTSGLSIAKNTEMAEELLQMAAEQGNAKAMSYLGRSYFSGTWLKENHKKALQYSRQAAELGDDWGMFSLGLYYYFGSCGLPQDAFLANHWISKAAKKGNEKAKEFLQDHGYSSVDVNLDKKTPNSSFKPKQNQSHPSQDSSGDLPFFKVLDSYAPSK